MTLTVNVIESLLVAEDIEGLIEQGAPEDEYASEAASIYEALIGTEGTRPDVNQMARIISVVWAQHFNVSVDEMQHRRPAIRRVALIMQKKLEG